MQTKLDKAFKIIVDISNRKVTIPQAISWYVTDENIAHLNCQIIDEVEDSIIDIQSYKLSMRVLTPSRILKEVNYTLSDATNNIFTLTLPDELITEKGRHQCELSIEYLGDKLTSEPFNYNIIQSIANQLDSTISKDSHYPLVLELEDKLKEWNNILDEQVSKVIILDNDVRNAERTRQANEAQRVEAENGRQKGYIEFKNEVSEVVDGFSGEIDIINSEKVNILTFEAIADYDNNTKVGTDNSIAINLAIEYAEQNNMSIFIPPGDYKIEHSIIMHRNTKIISQGATLWYSGDDVAISCKGNANSHIYPFIQNLIVHKINTDKQGIGIKIEYSRMGGKFIDCTFAGFEYGIYHSESTPINQNGGAWSWLNTFERCKLQRNKIGVFCDVNSNGVSINNCLINNNSSIGAYIKSSTNVRITNCEFEHNGKENGGHAILLDSGISCLISGNYLEANGYNDEDSAVVQIGSSTGLSSLPQIISNYFMCSGATIGIKANECQTVYISGNMFYKASDNSLLYDIDLLDIYASVNSFVMGNYPSEGGSTTEKIRLPKNGLDTRSWISHGDGIYKSALELRGSNSKIILHDDRNNANVTIDTVNNKIRLFNKNGESFVTFNGDSNKVHLAIQGGSSANRPSFPLPTGTMYYDTTLGKPIWSVDNVWKDAAGNTV